MEFLTDESELSRPESLDVLLVDDDRLIHAILGATIRRGGHTLTSATNALDAIRKMRSCIPDVVITDAMMPGMSGFDLIRQIKMKPATTEF